MAGNVYPPGCDLILIATLGCRLNQTESEAIAKRYSDAGKIVTQCMPTASSKVNENVSEVIVNTCAVTQKAEQKARRTIRLLLEKCPNAAVIVTGCYAALRADEIKKIDERITVCPKHLIGKYTAFKQTIGDASRTAQCTADEATPHKSDNMADALFPFTSTFAAHSRASLKIQDGCNNSCAFCAIHIARGESVSLAADDAVRRAKEIEANGYKEVTLTGVNIGQWHSPSGALSLSKCAAESQCIEGQEQGTQDGEQGLSYLLERLLAGTSTLCFRLSSLHPDVIDEDFCRVISNKRIRPHFHLSVQSGSNKVLHAMGRSYTANDVIRAVNRLRQCKAGRAALPPSPEFRSAKLAVAEQEGEANPFIACDIITGFPGEGKEDFEATVELCRECGFEHIHAFPFSMRQGTAACKMRPLVPQSVAGERVKILEEISNSTMSSYVASCMGRVFSAIAEQGKAADSKACVRAVTENFLHVIAFFDESSSTTPRQGDEILVRITGQGINGADAVADVC